MFFIRDILSSFSHTVGAYVKVFFCAFSLKGDAKTKLGSIDIIIFISVSLFSAPTCPHICTPKLDLDQVSPAESVLVSSFVIHV